MLSQENSQNNSISDVFSENLKRNYDLVTTVQTNRDSPIKLPSTYLPKAKNIRKKTKRG